MNEVPLLWKGFTLCVVWLLCDDSEWLSCVVISVNGFPGVSISVLWLETSDASRGKEEFNQSSSLRNSSGTSWWT